MLRELQQTIKEKLSSAIAEIFHLTLSPQEIGVEFPPKVEMGDLAFPLAFELAKRIKAATGEKQNPRQLADKLIPTLNGIAGIARVETAGAGYLNLFLDRGYCWQNINKDGNTLSPTLLFGGKLIVEHTSINPNKAAHIGHLRNAVLGDTVVRMLRASGEEVEVHNYIDNTGVQVADVVVGFKYLENKSLSDISKISQRFDYYCWDLYARVGKFYEEFPEKQSLRAQTLHEIESNQGETAKIADYVSQRILRCHLDTMWRLGISYDLLARESDVLQLNFWQVAFEKLRANGAIYYETEGRNKGCWVMHAENKVAHTSAAKEEAEYEMDKILVRSNGIVTYTGKDIAYHLWKLGQIGLDFSYRTFYFYPNDHRVWITISHTDNGEAELRTRPLSPFFGNGVAYFNVIDVGQSYTQDYVKLGVKLLDKDARVEHSTHLAYEKVVLTPTSARELGYELSAEDSKRTQISMSGRKGLGVKADDLIDKLEEKAIKEVTKRHPEAREEEQRAIAHQIAIGALRYFLLKYTRSSIIAFDFDEALAFEGETGPYIQYALVRIGSIFRKLAAEKETLTETAEQFTPEQIETLFTLKDELTGWNGNYLWSLFYKASQLKDVLHTALNTLEPTHVAKYAYQLASNINEFYNAKSPEGKYIYQVVGEADAVRRRLLILLIAYVQTQLKAALGLLGIDAPEKM